MLVRMGGMPPALVRDKAFVETFLPIVRADFTACETHVVRDAQLLHCRVIAWAGARDWYAPPRAVARWRHLSGTFPSKISVFPGDHFFLRDRNFADIMLADIGWGGAADGRADRAGLARAA